MNKKPTKPALATPDPLVVFFRFDSDCVKIAFKTVRLRSANHLAFDVLLEPNRVRLPALGREAD